jgi:hypothetical protein
MKLYYEHAVDFFFFIFMPGCGFMLCYSFHPQKPRWQCFNLSIPCSCPLSHTIDDRTLYDPTKTHSDFVENSNRVQSTNLCPIITGPSHYFEGRFRARSVNLLKKSYSNGHVALLCGLTATPLFSKQ